MNIEYFGTDLRDGAQALPEVNQFAPGAKLGIADALATLGMSTIEAGFPATQGDAEEVMAVAESVGNTDYLGNLY